MIEEAEYGRSRSPSETFALVEPHFSRLGISRVARQTGLDRIGVPCFAAIRPNSRTLSAHYGKGLTDAAARTAAVMEALEFAIAEDPPVARRLATVLDLAQEGIDVFDCRSLLAPETELDPDLELLWVNGMRLSTGEPVAVPLEAVVLGDASPRLTEIAKTTSGLASGNGEDEAILHGLCELIERDALTLWSLQSEAHARAARFDPALFEDPAIAALMRRIGDAGMSLVLDNLTTDLGVPVVHATLHDPQTGGNRLFDFASGTGCHPNAVRASISAITEATQSRLTNIAGSRDDYSPGEYDQEAPDDLLALNEGFGLGGQLPASLCADMSVRDMIGELVDRLGARGVDDLICVPLGGQEMGVAVVRVLSAQLEDKLGNANWWPGARAIAELIRGITQ